MTCSERETMARLASLRAEDRLDAEGEALLGRHLAGCPACLAEAVPVDPTLLFARLSVTAESEELAARTSPRGVRAHREEPSEADLLAADVLAALRVRAAEGGRRPERLAVSAGPWLKAAAVVLLAAGLAAALLLTRPAGPGPEPVTTAVFSAAARPPIEELASPGARVYEFASSKPEEPTVVFVANPDADL